MKITHAIKDYKIALPLYQESIDKYVDKHYRRL